jgi:transglutaminase-like putative cysteine protease
VLAAAGRRAGLASIVLALGSPLLVTGLQPGSLFSPGPGTMSLPGDLAQLDESHPSVVFTYTTTAPAGLESSDAQYFTQYVFDTLSGTGWQAGDYARGAAPVTSMPRPQGLSDLSSSQPVKTTVTVSGNFAGPGAQPAFLPVPYPAGEVEAPGKWLADPDLMVYSTSSSIAGQTYSVQNLAVDPTPAQLEAVPALSGTPDLAPDLKLPPSYETAALKNLAQTHAGARTSEFGEVDALANWLSGPPFSYDHATVPFDDAAGLLSFLTKTRSGFCVQYAYAMTVLTRLLGIPARIVTGYTAGTRLANGSYVVKTSDAHAWPEVYFPSLGWIRFEPTPGDGGTASTPGYMISAAVPPPGGTIDSGTAVPAGPAVQEPASGPNGSRARHGRPGTGSVAPSSPAVPAGSLAMRGGTPWAALVLAVTAAVAAALGTPAAARAALRRRRWSGAADDASRAHAAWHEFRDDLADYGVGARPGEPPRALASRIAAGMPAPACAAIRRLALAEERASYSARPAGSPGLRRDNAAARRGLAGRARRRARWRARVFPASVTTALVKATARILARAAARSRHHRPLP